MFTESYLADINNNLVFTESYLVDIIVILDISAGRFALAFVEIKATEGNGREVHLFGTEIGSTGRVGSLSASSSTHVVDDGINVDVNLGILGERF